MRPLLALLALASLIVLPASAQKIDSSVVGLWGSQDSTDTDGLWLRPDGTFRQVLVTPGQPTQYFTGNWRVEDHQMCLDYHTPASSSHCWPYTVTPGQRLTQTQAVYRPLPSTDPRVRLLHTGGQ
jgi:hypothetical protein